MHRYQGDRSPRNWSVTQTIKLQDEQSKKDSKVLVKFVFKQNWGSPWKTNYFDLDLQIFSNLKVIFLKVQAVEQWKLQLCQVDLEMLFFWQHAWNVHSWILVTPLEKLSSVSVFLLENTTLFSSIQ